MVKDLIELIAKKEGDRYLPIKNALNEDIRSELISSIAFIAEQFATDP